MKTFVGCLAILGLLVSSDALAAVKEKPAPTLEIVRLMDPNQAWLEALALTIDDYYVYRDATRRMVGSRDVKQVPATEFDAVNRAHVNGYRLVNERPIVSFSGVYTKAFGGTRGEPSKLKDVWGVKQPMSGFRIAAEPRPGEKGETRQVGTFSVMTLDEITGFQSGDRIEVVALPMAIIDGEPWLFAKEIRKVGAEAPLPGH